MKSTDKSTPLSYTTTIDTLNAKKRLDKFLVNFAVNKTDLGSFSRGDFIRAIKNKEILVNNLKAKPSYRLSEGDQIKLNIKKLENKNNLLPNPKIKLNIIFEDENLIAIDKPAGLQVHPDHNEHTNTLLNGIIAKYPDILKIKENDISTNTRPGIVHRLDKDTSGIIVIAKNKKSFRELQNLFRKRKIQKKYLAIVYGEPQANSGIIDKPLAKKSNYKRQVVAGQKTKTKIRSAITKYNFVKKLKNGYSLLEVFPKTGRTHQIRVHLLSINNPIIGDKLYKSKSTKEISLANRQMLHAQEIKFKLFEKKYELSASPSKDFQKFL